MVRACVMLLLVSAAGIAGCGQAAPGGAPGLRGSVVYRGENLSGVRVTFIAESGDVAGTGSVGPDGRFELLREETAEGVTIHSGQFRVTLESTGGELLGFPPSYADAKKSPISVTCVEGQAEVDVTVPEPK